MQGGNSKRNMKARLMAIREIMDMDQYWDNLLCTDASKIELSRHHNR